MNIFSYTENGREQPIRKAMIKPLPYGCIKRKENPPTLMEFHQFLDRISHEDKIGNLFIVDIKFHNKNLKTLLFNKIYPPVLEKSNKMDPYERSCLQLLSVIKRNKEKDITHSFCYTSKTHSTLEKKTFIPLYAEHNHLVIKRAGWLVTKIYEHYTFEQPNLKGNL